MIQFDELPRTRGAAKSARSKYFYTGKACVRGHVEARLASTGACRGCTRERQRERLKDPSYRQKHNALALKSLLRRMEDPEFRARKREKERLASRKPSRVAKHADKDRERNQREETKARRRIVQTERYHKIKGTPEFAEKAREARQGWYSRHRLKAYEKCAARRALRKKATPSAIPADQRREIQAVYAEARRITSETGIPHEVDHIAPLKHAKCSGLHVPWNLQVMGIIYLTPEMG